MRWKNLFLGLFLVLFMLETTIASRGYTNRYGNPSSKSKSESTSDLEENLKQSVLNASKEEAMVKEEIEAKNSTEMNEKLKEWLKWRNELKWILPISFGCGCFIFALWLIQKTWNAKKAVEIEREIEEQVELEIKREEDQLKEKKDSIDQMEDKVADQSIRNENGSESGKEDETVKEAEKENTNGEEKADSIEMQHEEKEEKTSKPESELAASKGNGIVVKRNKSKRLTWPSKPVEAMVLKRMVMEQQRNERENINLRREKAEHRKGIEEKKERDEHFSSYCRLMFSVPQWTLFAWSLILYWNVDSFLTNASSFRQAQKLFEGKDGVFYWIEYFGFKDIAATFYQYAVVFLIVCLIIVTLVGLYLTLEFPLLPYLLGVYLFRTYFRSVARLLIFDSIILLLVSFSFMFSFYKKNKWMDRWTFRKVIWSVAFFASVFAGYHAANTDFNVNPDAEYESVVDVYILNTYWPTS
eukprot:TRINITY_DN2829_c1_g1_i1.p1 TRINITY_DN2829_c1_g1~~TRINITY_DN2829_c1_g1_i1.p1  ORF type:complete len:470 (-),score=185.56 TRINITY_DN2829_c1_g1_i1:155-1564(-)